MKTIDQDMETPESTGEVIDIPKDGSYPQGLGKVGSTGKIDYEVVYEDAKTCSIKITGVENDSMGEEKELSPDGLEDISVEGAEDSGEAADMYMDQMKKKKAKKDAIKGE